MPDIDSQDHEQTFQPNIGDIFGGDRPQNGAGGDADKPSADERKSTGAPLINIKVKIEVIMLINTARAEVPATTYMGRPATLVKKGT